VVGRHLPVEVKMDGAEGYGFGLASGQSVCKVFPAIRNAFNRVIHVMILVIICSNLVVFKYK
jgi:hypothetical protein